MHVFLLISTLALVGCWGAPARGAAEPAQSAQSARSAPAATAAQALFPPLRAPFTVTAGEGPEATIAALVESFSAASGTHFVASKETEQVLAVSRVGLTRPLEVAPDRAWELFETLLVESDFVIAPLMRGEPRVFGLYSLNSQQRNSLRNRALIVGPDEVAAYARHPALLVTTVVELSSTDVRTLSNSMRTMFTDANTQQIIPVGNSNSLIVTGFGPAVADIVAMLRTADESARLALERRPPGERPPPAPEEPPPDGKKQDGGERDGQKRD